MRDSSGIVSAYQILNYSAERTMAHDLSYTGAQELVVEVISLPDMEKLQSMEIIKVKISPLYDQLAFMLLAKRVPIQIFGSSVIGLRRDDLKILNESGIPYEMVG